MAETLYPSRQRCKTCRKALNKLVLSGLYCSYKCGGYALPAKTITEAPRSCKREVNNKWDYKVRFLSKEEVPLKHRNDPATNIYECENCHFLHIGHSRPVEPTQEQLVRYVKNFKELGSVVSRYITARSIDKKMLAKSLKIPVIRITEIEQGSPKASAHTLMLVLNALMLQINISEPLKRK